jgi:hypothetical protein
VSKKRKPHPGSRSLAEQLREAFPPSKDPKPAPRTEQNKGPAIPKVRTFIVPSKTSRPVEGDPTRRSESQPARPVSGQSSRGSEVRPSRPAAAKPTQRVDTKPSRAAATPPSRPSKKARPVEVQPEKPKKRLGAEPPPAWEPPNEEVFLEPAFSSEVCESVFPTLTGGPPGTTSAPTAPGIRRTQTVARIQVGLDFGTSATKVLWVRTGVPEPKISAIDFDHGIADLPRFCLPSLAAFDQRGNLLLGDVALSHMRSGPAGSALTRFKMLVAGEQDQRYLDVHTQRRFRKHVAMALRNEAVCTPEMITATYLAFVMRRVRRHLMTELDGLALDVSFATCVPVDQVQGNVVNAAFRRVVNAAELVEREAADSESGRAWLERSAEALSRPLLDEAEARLDLVPEAVAATAGYVHSVQRERGIHALIDIGAGTTDVSIFNVTDWGRGDPETFWYSARSIPRGTAMLELRLADELRRAGRLSNPRSVLALLQGDRDALPAASDLISGELETIWWRSHKAWGEAHLHLKNEVSWKGKAVHVFLSGGGALIPEAVRVFKKSWMQSPNWGPYPCETVPEPDGYDVARVGGPYIRTNVAHGLTRPRPELGKFVLPNDAPDHTPPPLPRREAGFDGDQLVPKYGWT